MTLRYVMFALKKISERGILLSVFETWSAPHVFLRWSLLKRSDMRIRQLCYHSNITPIELMVAMIKSQPKSLASHYHPFHPTFGSSFDLGFEFALRDVHDVMIWVKCNYFWSHTAFKGNLSFKKKPWTGDWWKERTAEGKPNTRQYNSKFKNRSYFLITLTNVKRNNNNKKRISRFQLYSRAYVRIWTLRPWHCQNDQETSLIHLNKFWTKL